MTDDIQYTSITIDDTEYETKVTTKFQRRKPYAAADPKKILCLMPGIVQKIYVVPGQQVARGNKLLIVESMKMKNDIVAMSDGIVKQIPVTLGVMVVRGQVLVEFD
jgi:glutaconyl-CoA/methylmalonyl-CoA decarboxylase subunit gamma